MPRRAPASAIIFCLFALPAVGQPADTRQKEQAEILALSEIMSGVSNGIMCDFSVDETAVERFLIGKYGREKTFSSYQIAYTMWAQATMPALAATVVGLPKNQRERKAFCSQTLSLYGPNGTKFPGLLKP
jgi:hypothetical protein